MGHSPGLTGLDKIITPSLPHISLWLLLYIFSCRRSFLLYSGLSPQELGLRELWAQDLLTPLSWTKLMTAFWCHPLEGIRKTHLKLKFEKKIIWNHYDDGKEKTRTDWVVVLSLWQVNYELWAIYLISECWFHLQKWRWQVWSVAFKLCSVDVCELWWDI